MIFPGRALPLAAVLLAAVLATGARATTLQAEYSVSVRGIPVGKATLAIDAGADRYRIKASGRLKGLFRIFSDSKASGEASGSRAGEAIVPARYEHRWTEDDDKEVVSLHFAGRELTEVSVTPPPKPRKSTVPVTGDHKADVLDPLSAMVFPADPNDGSSVCNRNLPLFDGTQRFDLNLTYSRTEQVDGGKESYSGPAHVCAVRYNPVAGHRPGRSSVKFMQDNRDIEVWMAPVGGTGLMAPMTMRVRTKAGMLVLEAQRFSVE